MAPLATRCTCIQRLLCRKSSIGVTLVLRQVWTAQVWATPPVWCDVIDRSLYPYLYWSMVCRGSTPNTCWGRMNNRTELSGADIYTVCVDTKYSSCRFYIYWIWIWNVCYFIYCYLYIIYGISWQVSFRHVQTINSTELSHS